MAALAFASGFGFCRVSDLTGTTITRNARTKNALKKDLITITSFLMDNREQ
jgi:hypothetical protein